MIDYVIFDIDGVLTDGAVYIDAHGNEAKRILYDDIDAIFELKRSGIRIGFITGEDTKFTAYVKERFTPDIFAAGCKDKLGCFRELEKKHSIDRSKTCFVGDSKKDIELLQYVNFSFVPADVDFEIKKHSKFVTRAKRGNGVIKEVAKVILSEPKYATNESFKD
jgi:3-deoxy-D-manno-octulosonate 8-phosphate phosphatase (KDO 8-P phosphatase)